MGNQNQNNEQFEERAQQLTTRVERGVSVSDELNGMPFKERLEMAKRMDEINADHRSTNAKLPDIELVTGRDSNKDEHLMDMTTREKGIIWDTTEDVYNMPNGVEKKFMDNIANTQLTRDILDSHNRFGTPTGNDKLDCITSLKHLVAKQQRQRLKPLPFSLFDLFTSGQLAEKSLRCASGEVEERL